VLAEWLQGSRNVYESWGRKLQKQADEFYGMMLEICLVCVAINAIRVAVSRYYVAESPNYVPP